MAIGGTDKITSTTLKKRQERQWKEKCRASKRLNFATEPAEHKGVIGADQNCETENEDMSKDVDYEEIYLSARPTTSKPTRKQVRKKLPKLAKICDRYGTTDRIGAAIATAVMEDFRIVTKDDPSNVIDQYKVRRERAASRVNVSDEGNAAHGIQTLYFDGRKDKTFKLVKKGLRW